MNKSLTDLEIFMLENAIQSHCPQLKPIIVKCYIRYVFDIHSLKTCALLCNYSKEWLYEIFTKIFHRTRKYMNNCDITDIYGAKELILSNKQRFPNLKTQFKDYI